MASKVHKTKRPPQLNKFMHPRNPYKATTSFKQLAISYPEFRSYCTYDVSGKVYIDFKNIHALKALTTCLLHKDFGLQVNIPDGRLVPTLPLRMNYLLWIEDLLSLASSKALDRKETVVGVDIGTGACCVYPLLGARKFGWHFVATETDELNFQSANENINKNNLEDLIQLKKTSHFFDVLKDEEVLKFVREARQTKEEKDEEEPKDDGVSAVEKLLDSYKQKCLSSRKKGEGRSYPVDFTMCNPPFFSSEADMDTNQKSKKPTRCQPSSVSTGSVDEKVTEGGEMTFIAKMVNKSLEYKDQVRIFTTLIGKKSDVKGVTRLIREEAGESFVCVAQTEFCQGRTMRWGVAWTFDACTALSKVVSKKQRLCRKPSVLAVPRSLMASYSVGAVWARVVAWLKDVKIKPHVFKSTKYYVGATVRAYKATWLHQRQKKRRKEFRQGLTTEEEHAQGKVNNAIEMDSENGKTEESPEKTNIDSPEKRGDKYSPAKEETESATHSQLERRSDDESPPRKRKREHDQSESSGKVDKLSSSDSLEGRGGNLMGGEEKEDGEEGVARAETPPVPEPSQAEEEDVSVSGPAKGAGLECVLKCALHLKQTEAMISVEMSYQSGCGGREAMQQLMQYLENKMKNDRLEMHREQQQSHG